MKSRLGFIRSREFIMKDLYTFDVGPEEAQSTYEIVNKAYENIFKRIGVEYTKGMSSYFIKLSLCSLSLIWKNI